MDFLAQVLGGIGLTGWAEGIRSHVAEGGKFNPEWISNLDPLFIVFLQIIVSLTVAKMGRFPGMITGIMIAGIGIALPASTAVEPSTCSTRPAGLSCWRSSSSRSAR